MSGSFNPTTTFYRAGSFFLQGRFFLSFFLFADIIRTSKHSVQKHVLKIAFSSTYLNNIEFGFFVLFRIQEW